MSHRTSSICPSCGCVRPSTVHARRYPDGLCRLVREAVAR